MFNNEATEAFVTLPDGSTGPTWESGQSSTALEVAEGMRGWSRSGCSPASTLLCPCRRGERKRAKGSVSWSGRNCHSRCRSGEWVTGQAHFDRKEPESGAVPDGWPKEGGVIRGTVGSPHQEEAGEMVGGWWERRGRSREP